MRCNKNAAKNHNEIKYESKLIVNNVSLKQIKDATYSTCAKSYIIHMIVF